MNLTSAEIYVRCSIYEPFIYRALGWERDRLGGDISVMINLVNAEHGLTLYNKVAYSRERLLANAQEYITKAFDALLKKRFKEADKEILQTLRDRVKQAHNSDALLDLIKQGLDVMDKTDIV